MKPDFLFDQEAAIRNYLGYDMKGIQLEEPVLRSCRIQAQQSRVSVRSKDSGTIEEVISNAKAFFPAGTRFNLYSVISVGDIKYEAVSIAPKRAFGAETHVEAMLL